MGVVRRLRNLALLAGLGYCAYMLLLDQEARQKFERASSTVVETVKTVLEKIESLQGTVDESDELERVLTALDLRWQQLGY